MPETVSLRVPKGSAQTALTLIREGTLLNLELKLDQKGDYILIPLLREPSPDELAKLRSSLPDLRIETHEFQSAQRKPATLVELLGDSLPPHMLASLPRAIDFVGDIAVVEVPPELEEYKQMIGEVVLKTHKRIKTVLAKWSPVTGAYRLRTFEVIGGQGGTQTVHREHGCIFHVDLAKTYFTPRLSYEHYRVASLVRDGETVLDMFAGVGPFSILIAAKHANTRVYAVDMNPDAYEFLKKNIIANRVVGRVTAFLGDARHIVKEKLTGIADRVIMNLPEKAIEYVDSACSALKPDGGVIHYYQFADAPEPTETAKTKFTEAVGQTDRRLNAILQTRVVRGIAPFTYQVAVDAEIR